ncbi:MAG: carbohydrate porin [Fluviibacter sp.]
MTAVLKRTGLALFCLLLCGATATRALADSPVSDEPIVNSEGLIPDDTERWNIHGQSTYIVQWKNNFSSPDPGAKSLLNNTQGDNTKSYTWSITPFMGARLWEGAEVYYNPEGNQGMSFSQLSGLGGFTNGELQKGNAVPMIWYNARAFLRQSIGLGGGLEHIESGPNQLAGNVDKRRLVMSYGWFSALDFFDGNRYSHDPRLQFMNWSIMANGAYDFAANSRGYTYGLAGEYYDNGIAFRIARFAMPKEPNGLALDYQLTQQYGDQAELEVAHQLFTEPGKIRLLVFQNRGWMASYAAAVSLDPSAPNIMNARTSYQTKWGYGINLEQGLTESIGAFTRYGWNNGQTETQAFTDIDRSLSGGLSIKGTAWSRENDTFGLGFAINGVAGSQVDYLSRGGSTMFIGDGYLRYQTERILETYYSAQIYKGAYVSADYQYIQNPAYNSARGPVNFFGVRAHYEF